MNRHFIQEIKMNICDDNSYISSLPVVQYLNKVKSLSFDHDVTFLVGENGTGKSTLIEAIAICAGFNAEGGSKNFNFFTKQTASNLYKYMTIIKKSHEKDGFFLRAESFYNVASQVDVLGLNLAGYGGKSLHEQSHGESFLSLVQSRFHGNGLYILDEPESALSPLRQFTLIIEIKKLIESNSQFIIATHSPILLAFPDAAIYQISKDGLKIVEYEKCEHYILMKQFLDNPKHFIKYLLE